ALESLDEIASAWADELPLLPAERDVLPGLTAIRMVTTIALASHRAQLYPGNAPYILRNLPSARAGLLALPQPDEAL
ncbi:MAG: aminoglycoside phosphotransferase, partial [Gemmobacter sp.]